VLFRLLRIVGDAKVISRGPAAYAKRRARRVAHRAINRRVR
jgi:hypothetical protein